MADAAAKLALFKAAFAGAKALVGGFFHWWLCPRLWNRNQRQHPGKASQWREVDDRQGDSDSPARYYPLSTSLEVAVPIVVKNNGGSNIGMDMLAAAVARGYQMAPQPVVSVEEINRTQRRVQTIENIGRI